MSARIDLWTRWGGHVDILTLKLMEIDFESQLIELLSKYALVYVKIEDEASLRRIHGLLIGGCSLS